MKRLQPNSSKALIGQNKNEAAALLRGVKVAATLAMPFSLTMNPNHYKGKETTQQVNATHGTMRHKGQACLWRPMASHVTNVKRCNTNQNNIEVSVTQNAPSPMLMPGQRKPLTTEMVELPAEWCLPDHPLTAHKTNWYENMVCRVSQSSKISYQNI